MITTLVAAIAVGSLIAQSPPTPEAPALGGTSWQLVAFHGMDDTTVKPDHASKYTLRFGTDGRVTARIDCNRGGGNWTAPASGQLELGPLALTRAMCPPGSMHDRIVTDWGRVRSYVMKDGHLFLSLMADGGIYEFEPMPPASLEGSAWQVTALDNGHQAVATPVGATPLSIAFARGVVSGNAGCNRFHGPYSKEGSHLSFGPLAVTRRACTGEGVMEQEQRFVSALASVAICQVEGETLVLQRADASRVVEARKVAK
jgi:heat shock protein HslJ